MQDEYAKENVGVAAHEANPAWFAFEDHEDGEVDDGGCEGCAGTDEGSEGHAVEGRIGVCFVGMQAAKGDDEKEGKVDLVLSIS